MSVIDTLAVELTLEAGKFTGELTKTLALTDKSVKQFEVSFSRMGKEIAHTTMAIGAFGVAAAAVAAGALSVLVAKAYESGDAFNKMSERMGVSVEWLQKMDFAAQQSGASIEDIGTAMRFLSRNISNAAAGGKQQIEMFEELGVSVDDLRKMSPEKQFETIADALSKVSDQTDKTRLMMEAFGRGAMALNGTIKDGKAGLKEMGDQAEAMGIVFGKDTFNRLEATSDALERIGIWVKAAGTAIADILSPYVMQLADSLTGSKDAMDAVREATVWAVDMLIAGAKRAADAWQGFGIMWAAIKLAIGGLSVVLYTNLEVTGKVVTAIVDKLRQAGEAIGAGFWAMYKTAELSWVSIKGAVFLTLSAIQAATAGMLIETGKALSYLPGSVGAAVQQAGQSLLSTVKKDVNTTTAEIKQAAINAEDAWSTYGTKVKETLTGPFKTDSAFADWANKNREESVKLVGQWAEDLNKLVNAPLSARAIDDWVAKARTAMNNLMKPKGKGGEGDDVDPIGKGEPKTAVTDEQRKSLEDLRKYTSTEMEIEEKAYSDRQQQATEALSWGLISQEEYNEMSEDIEKKHQDNLLAIDDSAAAQQKKQWESGWSGKMQIASKYLGNIATLMNSKNKQMFEVGKIAAYAQTVVNTAEAAMSAFKFGTAIGGPVVGAAFAATAVAAGMVQLQTIQSTSFGGGGSPSSGGGGSPSVSGAPMPGELNNRGIPSMQGTGKTIVVNLQGSRFSDTDVRDLIDQINEQQADGITVN
jgi:hypothetical protein